jgi:hypothetical protein
MFTAVLIRFSHLFPLSTIEILFIEKGLYTEADSIAIGIDFCLYEISYNIGGGR